MIFNKIAEVVEINGFKLSIDTMGGLTTVKNPINVRKDLHIPSVLPSGSHISFIARGAFDSCKLGRVIIDDDISVAEGSFENADINTVVWPKSNTTIPSFCFRQSRIGRIEGIENVVSIGEYAFGYAAIGNLRWPDNVCKIPVGCFASSRLRTVTAIDNISEIGLFAFSHAQLNGLDLSNSKVTVIGKAAFLGIDKDKITKPYYMTDDAFNIAFAS